MHDQDHKILVFVGLSDKPEIIHTATRSWKKDGLDVITNKIGWMNPQNNLNERLDNYTEDIDKLLEQNAKVSLVGISAGASFVFNLFYRRKHKIHKLINAFGRLREGENVRPTLDEAAKKSYMFKESVQRCEAGLDSLTPEDLKRILTVRAFFPDIIVPSNTTILEGATNKTIPIGIHQLAILCRFTIMDKPIKEFLNN